MNPSILIQKPLPRPYKYIKPKDILGKKWFDDARQTAEEKYNNHCWACGVHIDDAKYHKRLEPHEIWQWNDDKTIVLEDICALCYSCHNFIHSDYFLMFDFYGERRVKNVLEHGFGVLQNAGLKPNINQVLHYLHLIGKSNEEALQLLEEREIEIPEQTANEKYILKIGDYFYGNV